MGAVLAGARTAGVRWSMRGFMMEMMLQPSEIAPERVRPLRRTEYDLMVVAGAFEGERVELLSGALVEMTPQGTGHSESVARLSRLLTRALPDQYVVRTHSPFAATDDSEPEPDLAVVPDENYSARHPSTAFLVVEVADSSRAKDLGPKARLYAAAGIPEYWLVDLVDDVVLVHLHPEGGRYASVEAHPAGEVLKPTALPQVEVAVARLLP
ncbi:MAG TPA: Uma2 family endonuclease [Myxococcaceae bacterium]|nr:Uma2 family endonuclease [Myxococcaceae bacterium]